MLSLVRTRRTFRFGFDIPRLIPQNPAPMQTLRASLRPNGVAAPAAASVYYYYGSTRAGPI